MFRIDTTLDEPIRTSILCGRCANIEWVEGKKPKNFTCPSCGTELWVSEEE
jgi:transposase